MSDVNKYINAYIDTCVATINELNIKYIQSQAQAKVASDLVKEREETITKLISELESINQMNNEKQTLLEQAKTQEDSVRSLQNKLSHMDTLMQQMGQMKLEMKSKNEEIDSLKNKIIELTSKPVINRKKKETSKVQAEEAPIEVSLPETETVNDF